jgi:SAM-dependent methyltransferase
VEHVDEQAVQSITKYLSKQAIQPSTVTKSSSTEQKVAVLDLCSSWTSHIDTQILQQRNIKLERVTGLGMNEQELRANTILNDYTLQDLNENPTLPYLDNTFDVVLLQLSIDYLIQPYQVCSELLRVLKPGGTIHIIYSNRLFIQKAIASWTAADDIDPTYILHHY